MVRLWPEDETTEVSGHGGGSAPYELPSSECQSELARHLSTSTKFDEHTGWAPEAPRLRQPEFTAEASLAFRSPAAPSR